MASESWAPISTETVAWESRFAAEESRRARLTSRGPYEAALPPFIYHAELPQLDAHLLATAEDAVLEVSRFDAEMGGVVAPFSALLLRSESASSSEIERLTASARAIAMAELGRSAGSNAQLVVANSRAMESAVRLSNDLDEDAVVEMQRVLLGDSARDLTGRWRHEPVWVGGRGNSPHGAEFVPPRHERVPELMSDLLAFARRDDLPILPQVAIAHAQFETIHPFPDGNGRTGRALVHSMFRRLGVTRSTTVPVSAGLLSDTNRYFAALTAYRSGDLAPIVEVFVEASLGAVDNGRRLVAELSAVRTGWDARSTARKGSGAARAMDVLLRQQVVDANFLAEELQITPQNAQNAIDRLVDDGILSATASQRRNRSYEAAEVSEALENFAARARRRS